MGECWWPSKDRYNRGQWHSDPRALSNPRGMAAMTSCAIPIGTDDAFTAISNSRRRHVICILKRRTGAVDVRDLAVDIAAIENQCRSYEVTSTQRKRIYISLIQTHLDRLDSLEVIDYDSRSKRVRATYATQPLAHYIQQLTTRCSAVRPHPSGSAVRPDCLVREDTGNAEGSNE